MKSWERQTIKVEFWTYPLSGEKTPTLANTTFTGKRSDPCEPTGSEKQNFIKT